jgi:hypothetical protein
MKMEQQKLLSNFFGVAVAKECITATHISMFMSIYHIILQSNGFETATCISRREIMRYSKIKSIVTYHKILDDLVAVGIISYSPSYHPGKKTTISLLFDYVTPSDSGS